MVVGGLVGIIASPAALARRAGAILLWALGTAAIAVSLGLGYRAVQTFAMAGGNWFYKEDHTPNGFASNGPWGFLIPVVAATLLYLAWGLCRGLGAGLAAFVLVPLATPAASFGAGLLGESDARHVVFIVVWAVVVLLAVVLGNVVQWLSRPRAARAEPAVVAAQVT